MDSKGIKPRIEILDLVKGLAIMWVVLSHTVGDRINVLSYDNISSFLGIVIHQFCSPACPIFLFVTGFLLSSKNIVTLNYIIRNQIIRIYIPYLFWVPIFFALIGSSGIRDLRGIVIKTVLFRHVYWYFGLLLVYIFLVIPLLSRVNSISLRKYLKICVLISIALNLISTFLFYIDFKPYRSLINYFLIMNPLYWGVYFLFGYITGKLNDFDRLVKVIRDKLALIIFFGIIFFTIASLERYILVEIKKISYTEMIVLLRLTAQFYCFFGGALGIAIMSKLADRNLKYVKYVFKLFGRHSLQIYLAHPFIVFWIGPKLFPEYASSNICKVFYFVFGLTIPVLAFFITKKMSVGLSRIVWGN